MSTGAVDLNSNGGNIETAAITGGSQNLSLNSGSTGSILVTGAVDGIPTLDITNSNGATFNSTVAVHNLGYFGY